MSRFLEMAELLSDYGDMADNGAYYELSLYFWCDRDPLCRKMRRKFPQWKFRAGSRWTDSHTGKIAVILMFPPKE